MCVACRAEGLKGDNAFILGLVSAQIMSKDPRIGRAIRGSLCERHRKAIEEVGGVRMLVLAEAMKNAYA